MRFPKQFTEARQKIIFEYFDKFPNAGVRTIASIIYKKHPEYWGDYENCRSHIRHFRGLHGAKALQTLKNKKYVRKQV